MCASATQRSSVGSCEGGNHTHMSMALAPVLLQGPRCVLWKPQVMFSVLLHFFMLGHFNLAAVLNCEGRLSGKCSSSLGCLGDAHGWSLTGRSAAALWKAEGLSNKGELTKGLEKYKTKGQVELSSAARLMLEGCSLWGGWGLLWGMGNLAHLSVQGKASVLVPVSLYCLLLCLFRRCFCS